MRRRLVPRRKNLEELSENLFSEDGPPPRCTALDCTDRIATHRSRVHGVPLCAVHLGLVRFGETVIFEIGTMHYMFGSEETFRKIRAS